MIFGHMYSKFGEEIEGRFLDENDALTYLAKGIQDTDMFKDSVIFIDEFVRIYSSRI